MRQLRHGEPSNQRHAVILPELGQQFYLIHQFDLAFRQQPLEPERHHHSRLRLGRGMPDSQSDPSVPKQWEHQDGPLCLLHATD